MDDNTSKWDKIFKDLSLDTPAKAETIFIQYKKTEYGPILVDELHSYIQFLKDDVILFRENTIQENSNLKHKWQNIVKHPYFQRRKKDNNEAERSLPEQFNALILRNGIKAGPCDQDMLKKMVDSFDFLVTDFISIDNGKTWLKLCQYSQYNRRSLNNLNLPYAHNGKASINPQNQIKHLTSEYEISKLADCEYKNKNNSFETEQKSSNLYKKQYKHAETKKTIFQKSLNNINNPQNTFIINFIKIFKYLMPIALIASIILFKNMSTKKNNISRIPLSVKTKQTYTVNPIIKKRINNFSLKMIKNKKKNKKKIKQRSIVETKIFKDRRIGELAKKDILENNLDQSEKIKTYGTKENLYPEDIEKLKSYLNEEDNGTWVKAVRDEYLKNNKDNYIEDSPTNYRDIAQEPYDNNNVDEYYQNQNIIQYEK